MVSRLRNPLYCLAVAGFLTGFASAGRAANCDPQNILGGGLTLRDLSRDVRGRFADSTSTYTNFRACPDTATLTRTVLQQPFEMDLKRHACDEVPELDVKLRGSYYSTVRLNDTHPNLDPATDPNPRIGYEYVKGSIIDKATGVLLGTFEMNGVIGTNTSRDPMPDAHGRCYDCSHHEGYITFKFTHDKFMGAALFAEYHLHTPKPDELCLELPWCEIKSEFYGVIDGIYLNRCGPLGTREVEM